VFGVTYRQEEIMKNAKNWKKKAGPVKVRTAGPVYGMGFIGAAVYYVNIAHGFGSDLVGILKALVWPAFLVYHLLGL